MEITETINMRVLKELLVGKENKIEMIFELPNSVKHAIIEDFKLKINILEQKTLTGTTVGSQISYKDAKNTQQTYLQSFEKPLSEFTTLLNLSKNEGPIEFKVDFNLLPINESPTEAVIRFKLNFELLTKAGRSIQNINVEWIRSKIIILSSPESTEKNPSFTLQNIGEDIEDLSKFTVGIHSLQKGATFLLGKTNKAEAALTELLPGTTQLARDEQTKPIKIAVNAPADKTAMFSILVSDSDTAAVGTIPSISTGSQGNKSGMDPKVKGFHIDEEQVGLDEERLKSLREDQKILDEQIRKLDKQLEEGKKSLRQKLSENLKRLKEESKQELEGKTKEEKHIIKKKYRKLRKELIKESGSELLRNQLNYIIGFGNALGNSLLALPVYKSKNLSYAKGKNVGYKAGLVAGRAESVVGPGLIIIGLGIVVGGAVPSLGTLVIVGGSLMGVGAVVLTHGIFTVERTQTKLDEYKEKQKRLKEQRRKKNKNEEEEGS